ncbi:hypothetical protein [Mesorhizobium sp. KR9-304]|uniref:hypothetical protein n=1 Tax=Mesorhizobium sp. KR9-304 TaxID=3156614 RepID=UPI0032B4983C
MWPANSQFDAIEVWFALDVAKLKRVLPLKRMPGVEGNAEALGVDRLRVETLVERQRLGH